MRETIPYRKLFRLAFVTSPLFGIFGATPVFVFNLTEWSRISVGFAAITVITFIFWMINAAFLYLWQRFDFKGKEWLRYAASSFACILLIVLLSFLVVPQPGTHPAFLPKDMPKEMMARGEPPKMLVLPFLQALSINIIIMVLLELMLLRQKKEAVELENTQLRMVNLEARHSQLKQQLHPHFLFNSLSTLRSLINRSPEQAEDYLDKLSELLRFSTTKSLQAVIQLSQELELCENYLAMQKVRFGHGLSFSIEVSEEIQAHSQVPVYSIQLLVENAIKHNVITLANPLFVLIKGNDTKRSVTVVNNLQLKPNVEESTGVGLANLSERCRLMGQDDIEIRKTDAEFSVTLKLFYNESGDR